MKQSAAQHKLIRILGHYTKEDLPIQVRIVRTASQLNKAIDVRADAYGRHTPEFADALRRVEEDDISRESLVLLCESKVTGDPVGTLRIHTNDNAPTYLEKKIKLPKFLTDSRLAYVTRLGVASGIDGNYVKIILFKALFRYCFATQIPWILAVARKPVDRDLVSLGFNDIFKSNSMIRQPDDFGEYDVRPLYFNVFEAEREWSDKKHPLYDFMINKRHPDIRIFTSVSSAWSSPRRREGAGMVDKRRLFSRELFVV